MLSNQINIRKLEAELWESADLLREGSNKTSQEYCMPVLALLFLRYAYSRYKLVEKEILKDRPVRNGRVPSMWSSATPYTQSCPQAIATLSLAGIIGRSTTISAPTTRRHRLFNFTNFVALMSSSKNYNIWNYPSSMISFLWKYWKRNDSALFLSNFAPVNKNSLW